MTRIPRKFLFPPRLVRFKEFAFFFLLREASIPKAQVTRLNMRVFFAHPSVPQVLGEAQLLLVKGEGEKKNSC